MTNAPNGSGPEPEDIQPSPTAAAPPPRRPSGRVALWVGAIAVLVGAGGALGGWIFVNRQLSPWAARTLSQTLDRPVELGEVEQISPFGVRFGPSAVPATDADPDTLYAESIHVGFNPFHLLGRRFQPRITVSEAQLYVEQGETGQWLDLDLDLPEREPGADPFIAVNPTIVLNEVTIMAQPYGAPAQPAPAAVSIERLNGTIALTRRSNIDDPRLPDDPQAEVDAQRIRLDLQLSPAATGNVAIQAEVLQYLDDPAGITGGPLDRFQGKVAADIQALDLASLAPVVLSTLPIALPLSVTAGQVDGTLEVELTPLEAPRLTGSVQLQDGAIAPDALEQPIDNIGARLRFQGNRVAVENATAQYGSLTARGGGLIDSRNGYDLQGEIEPFNLEEVTATLPLDLPAVSGRFQAEGSITGPLTDPEISGSLQSVNTVSLDRVDFAEVSVELAYQRSTLALTALVLEPVAGGRLAGEGSLSLTSDPSLTLDLTGENLPADAIAQGYGLPDTIVLGRLALDAAISGPLDDLTGTVNWQAPEGTYPTRGRATLRNRILNLEEAIVQVAGGTLAATGTLANGNWDADVVAQGIQLGQFTDGLNAFAPGALSGSAQLRGSLDDLSLSGLDGSGDLATAIAGGTLTSQFTLAGGGWTAAVQGQGLNGAQFAPGLPVSAVGADGRFTGSLTDLSPEAIQGEGTLAAAIAGGQVVTAFTLASGLWQLDGQGSALQLAQLSPQLRGTGDGTFQLAGSLTDFSPNRLRGSAQITLSQGLATLARLSPQLAAPAAAEPLTADLAWDGQILRVNEARGAGLLARGVVQPRFGAAPGIANLDLLIQARNYALATLPVPVPTALALGGQASFDGRLTGTPGDLNLAGNVDLVDLAVNELAFEPRLSGPVRFSSRDGLAVDILGDRDQIVATYGLASRQADFRIQAGESVAVGDTEGDRLRARVYNFPLSLLGLPPANANRFGTLRGNVEFASATVDLQTRSAVGQFNVNDLGLGYVSVDRLFGGFTYRNGVATLDNGEIRMVDVNNAGEIQDERIYAVAGRFGLGQDPEFQGRLSTDRGTLQDVLSILKITELADVGRNLEPPEGFIPRSQAEVDALLTTVPAGDPNASLLNTLRRLSELQELAVINDRTAQDQPLPPLAELNGVFRGDVSVSASRLGPFQAAFDLEGRDWRWGRDFRADQVIAQGSYQDGLFALNPLRLASEVDGETAAITLVGTTATNLDDRRNRTLRLDIENVPVDALQDPLNLPFPIAGQMNGSTILRGSIVDPTLEGNVVISEGSLNNRPIDRASANFTYAAARLDLDSRLELLEADDPLQLRLSLPYRPAFVRRRPVDETVLADIQVRDEGLALVNLLTDRVQWQTGDGELVANLRSRWNGSSNPGVILKNLEALDGYLRLNGATLGLQPLPEAPLTNVQAAVRLAGFRRGDDTFDLRSPTLVVDEFSGDFSQGRVTAQGVFPLVLPLTANPSELVADAPSGPDQPLAIALDDLNVTVKGLYTGQVNGDIVLGGSLLAGVLVGGDVALSQGRISIPEGGNGRAPAESDGGLTIPDPRYSDFQVSLDRQVQVVQGNLLSVTAQGDLLINGVVTRPEPLGLIRLTSGRISLLTTTLRLTGDDNRADFRGNLDPILRVALATSVPDSNNRSLLVTSSPFPRNEVTDVDVENLALTQGGVRTIRIRAEVDAPASQLRDITGLEAFRRVVQLTSSPQRSETEIFSLLSGDVLTAIGSAVTGDGNQNVEGVAGAVAVNFLQNLIGDAVPIDEFRLFPVTADSGQVNESFDVGAEVGANLSPTIALSVLKVLTNDTPFQFNARYRINDQFTLRGTTSYEEFRERSGILLEYETRF
jgi:translocation and assembly module TamB